jgi:hypothetical protein|eukprot:scaffold4152_cov278-Alexandrium_tamarense.AAC.4
MDKAISYHQWRKRRYLAKGHHNERSKHRVNKAGETSLLSKHFDGLREYTTVKCLPYQNIPWDVNKHYTSVDIYEFVVMLIFVLPQIVYVYPILFIVLLLPVSLNLAYIHVMVPTICETIPRDTISWRLHCIIQALLCIPAFVVALTR